MIEAIKYIILIFLLDQLILTILKKANPKLRKFVFLAIFGFLYAVFYEVAVNRLPPNYFETFSTNRILSQDVLKKSFRKLSLVYHPDRVAADVDPNIFQDIRFQYETLSDEKTRQIYDRFGAEAVQRMKFENKEKNPNVPQESSFDKNQRQTMKKDGIYFMVFGVAFIAMCSDERLNKCRKLCLGLIALFYLIEVSFLWSEQQMADPFDNIIPTYAIWERIDILKAFVGLLCITIKIAVQMRLKKPDAALNQKLKQAKQIQEKINTKTRSIEPGHLVKECSGDSQWKKNLSEVNQLMKSCAGICEENSTEKKNEVKKKRKRRIKGSIMAVLIFTWAYYFAPF